MAKLNLITWYIMLVSEYGKTEGNEGVKTEENVSTIGPVKQNF